MSGFAADIIGLVGSALFIAAFAYANFAGALDKLWFNVVNLIGAALLLTSLSVHFNLAAVVLETAWGAIAFVGLIGELIRRRKAPAMIIAVDGPTASGKGTIARALAARFGLPHLDTGLLYRAVGRQVALNGGDPDDAGAAFDATGFADALLADPELRSEDCGGLASRVSIHPAVRAALFDRQRAFATRPGGAVLDGRDIGTVIVPEAQVKLFVTASARARADRRFREMRAAGRATTPADILADLVARDERDAGRADAPLRAAPDAHLLDTSTLDAAQAIAAAISVVSACPR